MFGIRNCQKFCYNGKMRRLSPMGGGRQTPPPPLPPLRPRKHHVSLEDRVYYWNQVLTKAFIAIIRYGLALLGLVVLALLTMIAFKDNIGIKIVIFAALFILALYPVVIVVTNGTFLILFGPGYFFTWREYKQKRDWEQMNKFYHSKAYRRLRQQDAIEKKAEQLMEQGADYHIGNDSEI